MKGKQAHSEADGLFMTTNRKHQILLNFELKRIAVEQKMRERYFTFEKSLVIARHEKIISRQKALGIYRPQTTPEKNRLKDSFFITAVAMETKARTKLPPLLERKGNASFDARRNVKRKSTKIKAAVSSTSFTITAEGRNTGRESFPVLKQKFALVQASKERSSQVLNLRNHASTNKLSVNSSPLGKNLEDSQEFVEEFRKAECQTRDVERQISLDSFAVGKDIKNKQVETDVEVTIDANDKVESADTNPSVQANEQVKHDVATAKTKQLGSVEKLEKLDLELESNMPKDSPKDAVITQKKEESLKIRDGHNFQKVRRTKSVFSGEAEHTSAKVIDMTLRAQSAGMRASHTS